MMRVMASNRIPCRVLLLLTLSLPDSIIVFMVVTMRSRQVMRFCFSSGSSGVAKHCRTLMVLICSQGDAMP